MPREMNKERATDTSQSALLPVPEMLEALTQYYESAGFSDVGARDLNDKSVDEIRRMYIDVFCKEEDLDESWRDAEEER